MAFPIGLVLGLAGSLLGLGGAKVGAKRDPGLDPALFGMPNESMLNPMADPGFHLISQLLAAQAQQQFQGGVPQIASLMQARGMGGGSGVEANLLGNSRNAAVAATIPQIAALLAQSRQMGFGRYMSAIEAARRAALLQASQRSQQKAQLSGGMFGLGGSLLGAALSKAGIPGMSPAFNPGIPLPEGGADPIGAGSNVNYGGPSYDNQWSDM